MVKVKAIPISIQNAFKQITHLEGRTPQTTDEEYEGAFAKLSDYGNGGIFITDYTGNSEWERHPNGDELVQVIEGETTLVLSMNGGQTSHLLKANDLLVVPSNIWHRFESPKGVKVMTITPQPTEHSIERPEND